MNKVILVVIIITLSTTAYFIFVNTKQRSTASETTTQSAKKVTTELPNEGAYVEYTQEKFNNAKNKKRVLFFYASWCPTCRPADTEFRTNVNNIPNNVVLLRTNYDTEIALKKKYAITYQHTFVQVDGRGNEIAKWNGGGLSELNKNLQ